MHSEFSKWFKEAVEGHGTSGDAQNSGFQRQSGRRYLYETGVWNGGVAFSAELGQAVWIEVKNMNIFGAMISIFSNNDGSRGMLLLPHLTQTFRFNYFGSKTVSWRFIVSTDSDAFVVQYAIYTTWEPGAAE